jgi:hypothetical protein
MAQLLSWATNRELYYSSHFVSSKWKEGMNGTSWCWVRKSICLCHSLLPSRLAACPKLCFKLPGTICQVGTFVLDAVCHTSLHIMISSPEASFTAHLVPSVPASFLSDPTPGTPQSWGLRDYNPEEVRWQVGTHGFLTSGLLWAYFCEGTNSIPWHALLISLYSHFPGSFERNYKVPHQYIGDSSNNKIHNVTKKQSVIVFLSSTLWCSQYRLLGICTGASSSYITSCKGRGQVDLERD